MLLIATGKWLKSFFKKAYDEGFNKGYEMGRWMERGHNGKGLIISGEDTEKEIEQILGKEEE